MGRMAGGGGGSPMKRKGLGMRVGGCMGFRV